MNAKRRELRYETLQDVVNEARQLAEQGYERAGEWQLGQVCNHLAGTINMSRDGFPVGLPGPIKRVMRLIFFGRVQRRIPTRLRIPTLPTLRQKESVPEEDGIDRLAAAIERLDEEDAQFVESPVFGKVTRDQWKQFHLWHCEHHMSFLLPVGDSANAAS